MLCFVCLARSSSPVCAAARQNTPLCGLYGMLERTGVAWLLAANPVAYHCLNALFPGGKLQLCSHYLYKCLCTIPETASQTDDSGLCLFSKNCESVLGYLKLLLHAVSFVIAVCCAVR